MVLRITYWMENKNETAETCVDLRVSEKYREMLVNNFGDEEIPVENLSEYPEFKLYLKEILEGMAKIQGYKLVGIATIVMPEEKEY